MKLQLQLLANGSAFDINQATKYESFDESTTLYKTRYGAWALQTPGDTIDRADKWASISEKTAYEWLIENDHADVIPDDAIAQLEI